MNWAVVIGIDDYWSERACLKSAVADALLMREWLLDPASGNVPEKNMMVAPPTREKEPGGSRSSRGHERRHRQRDRRPAQAQQRRRRAPVFLLRRSRVTARVNQRDENALVCSDFTDVLTTNSLALRSLWEFFETVQFQDQFFFVDACRNIPWENVEFEVGRWPLPRKRDPGLPPAQQFILYATSPGLRAQELQEAGNERGAFTEVLLDGLRGKSKAKSQKGQQMKKLHAAQVRRQKEFLRSIGEPDLSTPAASFVPDHWNQALCRRILEPRGVAKAAEPVGGDR